MNISPHTILVVDDEQRLRDLVRGYLEHEGFTVRAAADGVTALDLARQHAPDLVILDLMLPGLDGLEVCRRLRTFSDAYVIMLTAKTEEIDRIIEYHLRGECDFSTNLAPAFDNEYPDGCGAEVLNAATNS